MILNKFKAVIADTTCFILLQRIDSLNLLQEIADTVFTTPEVLEELGEKLPEWVSFQSGQNMELQNRITIHLDLGESSVIALASEIDHVF